jgi:NitT/TauT family transport system permease protein
MEKISNGALAAPLIGQVKEKEMTKTNWKEWFELAIPLISAGITIAADQLVKRNIRQNHVSHDWLTWLMVLAIVVYGVFLAWSFASEDVKKRIIYGAPFYAVLFQLLNGLNLVTAKFALIPVIYFPAPDRIFQVFFSDTKVLLSCIAYSYSLLAISWVLGVALGIATGAWLGFSRKASYWLWPFIRAIGPIPPVAWIPLALVIFPTMYSGSVFLLVLSIWFPTASLTFSGIVNVNKSYFEVAETLGASKWYQVFHVAIPAAMPDIFMGVFTGTCLSFVVLITAEMMGAKYGLGWYVNWQKEMMAYSNVYAGLILIAGSFCLFMSLLMRLKEHLMVWQKGVIR